MAAISMQQQQGWITSVHVCDLMAHVAANSLGTITNLEKMAAYGAWFMVKRYNVEPQ